MTKNNTKQIYLKKGRESSVNRLHPWVFSGAVERILGEVIEGDWVEVLDLSGKFLARGHYQPDSITVRILSYNQDFNTQLFWQNSLKHAVERRKDLFDKNTNIFRLVHGEGDGLSGLIIDIFNQVAVIQCHSAGMALNLTEISEALQKVLGKNISAIYNKSAQTLPPKWNDKPQDGFIFGNAEMPVEVLENGIKFHIDMSTGQKTGFFIDQRENRKLLGTYSKNKTVLNLFAYTGGFSMYALAQGATRVVSVDSSQLAMDWAKVNAEINGFTSKHYCETFDIMRGLQHYSKNFDIVVVDPPAFAKHISHRKTALKAYTRLNAMAMEKVGDGGLLFTFSCSQAISREDFRSAIFTAALQAKKSVRVLHQLSQPTDHAFSIFHPEGEYLKGLVISVSDLVD